MKTILLRLLPWPDSQQIAIFIGQRGSERTVLRIIYQYNHHTRTSRTEANNKGTSWLGRYLTSWFQNNDTTAYDCIYIYKYLFFLWNFEHRGKRISSKHTIDSSHFLDNYRNLQQLMLSTLSDASRHDRDHLVALRARASLRPPLKPNKLRPMFRSVLQEGGIVRGAHILYSNNITRSAVIRTCFVRNQLSQNGN